jgi:hypothetical protein
MSARRVALVVIAFVSLVAGHASAQQRKAKLQWERFNGEGTVAAYQNGTLLMTVEGQRWIGAVMPASKVKISGFANRNLLRPGVSPRPGERAGVFPDEVIDPTERKKGPPPPTARLRIFDAITGVKENALFFKKYRVEVSPDATITVDLADPSLLSQGDAIKKVKGRRIKGTQGRLMIEELEAELAQPLAAKAKAPSRAAKRETSPKDDVFGMAGEEATGKKTRKNDKANKNSKLKNGESEKSELKDDQPDEKDAKSEK